MKNQCLFKVNGGKGYAYNTCTVIDNKELTGDTLCILRKKQGKRTLMSKPMKLKDVVVGVPCIQDSDKQKVYHPFGVLDSLDFGFVRTSGKNIRG